jgi:hypothetical protein
MKSISLISGVCWLLLAAPAWGQAGKEKAKPKVELDTSWFLEQFMATPQARQVSLEEMMQLLSEFAATMNPEYRIVVDEAAFREAEVDVMGTMITLPPTPAKKTEVRELLNTVVKQLPVRGSTYLVRWGVIEITTQQAAAPERQMAHGKFVKVPLEDVLDQLSMQTGISIVLDAKAAEPGRKAVSGHFRSGVNLVTAVNLLADAAGLKAVVVDNVIYVTLPSNKAKFPQVRRTVEAP